MNENKKTLTEQLLTASTLIRRTRVQNRRERQADTVWGQGRILSILKMKPEIADREMAYLLGIGLGTLKILLERLEKAGYVTLIPAEDGAVTVKLNEERANADSGLTQIQEDLPLEALSEYEQARLGEYLDKLIKAMEEKLGDGGKPDENPGEKTDDDFDVRLNWRVMPIGGRHNWPGREYEFRGKIPRIPPHFFGFRF